MNSKVILKSAFCLLIAGCGSVANQSANAPASQPSVQEAAAPTTVASTQAAKPEKPPESEPQKWNQMDYGSMLSATFENRKGSKEFTNKGIAVTLGTKEQPAWAVFDTELLRYSSAWSHPGTYYLHFSGVAFDSAHGPMPSGWGRTLWAAVGQHPGVSLTDNFDDPRTDPYGPLPKDQWGHYKGLYRHGAEVTFNYEIAGCDVLEHPVAYFADNEPVIVRQIQVGPAEKAINIVVAEDSATPAPSTQKSSRPFIKPLQVTTSKGDIRKGHGARYLSIPPHKDTQVFTVAVARGDRAPKINVPAANFAELCKPGPANWPDKLETKGTLGEGDGPYVLDTITVPEENPYKSWMRFGGFDFFSDGRAAVSTWSGDVWIVSGIDDKLDHVTWKRFAAGLFQPLGLKIVKDEIYVHGRDQLTHLIDSNGDGEADHYENFNNDTMVSQSFHEFAFDLQQDSKGYFYIAKGGAVNPGGSGWQRITPHNGTIRRISPDGKTSETFATGVRAPNGMSMGPHDEITVSDNEGTWTPACRISFVTKGAFLGVQDLAHTNEKPQTYGDPICWLPHEEIDNSSGGGVWVTSDKWGPFKDRMLHTSYGTCSLFLVMVDKIGDVVQGGVVKFPGLSFESGIDRGRIGPKDGQVYLTGLKGWQTNGAKDACFHRIRYTGKPVTMPTSFHVKENGIEIGFTDPVDPDTAGDVDSYSVEQWNYIWSSEYGSPDVHVDDKNEKGREPVKITEARVSADKKSVFLSIPDIQPVMQMKIGVNIDAANGNTIKYDLYTTLNKVPGWKPKPKPTTSTKPSSEPTVSAK